MMAYGNVFFRVFKDGRRNGWDVNQIIGADFLIIIKNWFTFPFKFLPVIFSAID